MLYALYLLILTTLCETLFIPATCYCLFIHITLCGTSFITCTIAVITMVRKDL